MCKNMLYDVCVVLKSFPITHILGEKKCKSVIIQQLIRGLGFDFLSCVFAFDCTDLLLIFCVNML